MIQIHLFNNISCFQEINNLLKELSPDAEQITEHDLRQYLKNPGCYILTALDSEREYPNNIAGMATIVFIWKSSGLVAEIHDMVVTPA